jgi:hypothetical protein
MEKVRMVFSEFDMNYVLEKVDKMPIVCVIGKRGSGKSWIIKSIVYFLFVNKFPCVIVIAPTDKMNKFYDDFIPNLFIHHEFNVEILYRLFERQKNIIAKNEKRKKEGKKLIDPRVLLIMDDCMAVKDKWKNDNIIKELFFNGRHYNIFFII